MRARKSTVSIFVLCALLLGAVSAYYFYLYFTEVEKIERDTQLTLRNRLGQESQDLSKFLSSIVDAANETVVSFEPQKDWRELSHSFRKIGATGIGIVWLGAEEKALHFEVEDKLKVIDISKFYNIRSSGWFKAVEATTDGVWLSNYDEAMLNRPTIRYVQPIIKLNKNNIKELRGVFYVDVDPKKIRTMLDELSIGNLSQSFLIDKAATIISSPLKERHANIRELANKPGQEQLLSIINSLVIKNQGIEEYNNTATSESSWVIYDYLPGPNWIIVIIGEHKEHLAHVDVRRNFIKASLFFLLFLIFAIMSATGLFGFRERDWWASIAFISVLIIFFVLEVLFLHHRYSNFSEQILQDPHVTIITNEAQLLRFKRFTEHQYLRENISPAIYIPTGILLTFIGISMDGQLSLEGFIWQKYPLNHDIEHAVELLNVRNFTLEKSYDIQNSDHHLIGWHFKAVALNVFNFIQYPFDAQLLNLNFYHPDLQKNIILSPDFASYERSENLKGLKHNVQITSWKFNDTFFYYYMPNFRTNMGLNDKSAIAMHPDFYFAVAISREIISAMAMAILPLAIIAIIIFFVLLQSSEVERVASNTLLILPQLSAVFFAAIISHQSLRRVISDVNAIIYIEYYYFLLYALLMLVAINGVLYLSSKSETGLLFYRRNICIKLLYWPALFIFATVVTLKFFY